METLGNLEILVWFSSNFWTKLLFMLLFFGGTYTLYFFAYRGNGDYFDFSFDCWENNTHIEDIMAFAHSIVLFVGTIAIAICFFLSSTITYWVLFFSSGLVLLSLLITLLTRIAYLLLKIFNHLFGAQWRYAQNIDVRKSAVERLSDQKKLIYCAKNDENENIRKTAVNKLTDDSVLVDLAINDKSKVVRKSAMDKLTDQNILARIADKYLGNYLMKEIGQAAFERLSDQRILGEFAKKHFDGNVRRSAVERIYDQNILVDIAINRYYGDDNLRMIAIKKLTDLKDLQGILQSEKSYPVRDSVYKNINWKETQKSLADVAINSNDSSQREDAIARLTDQSILMDVALKSQDGELAVHNITDQTILKKVAQSSGCKNNIRIAAVQRLSDQNTLREIAKHEIDDKICEEAVARLSDQNALFDIARSHKSETIRKAAVMRLTIPDVLIDIAKRETSYNVRESVYMNLNWKESQESLADITKNASSRSVRLEALRKISDQNIIADVAKYIVDPELFMIAINSVTDQNILMGIVINSYYGDRAIEKFEEPSLLKLIAKNALHSNVRLAATEKLSDQLILSDIAKNDKDEKVRLAAIDKLLNQEFLAGIVIYDSNLNISRAAVEKIFDQDILYEIVLLGRNFDLSLSALRSISEKKQLYNIARECKDHNIRIETVNILFKKHSLNTAETTDLFKFYLDAFITKEKLLDDSDITRLNQYYKISGRQATAQKNNILESQLESLSVEAKDELNSFMKRKITDNLNNLRSIYLNSIYSRFEIEDPQIRNYLGFISQFIEKYDNNLILYNGKFYSKINNSFNSYDPSVIKSFPRYFLYSYNLERVHVGTQKYTHCEAYAMQFSMTFKLLNISTQYIITQNHKGSKPVFPPSIVGIPGRMQYFYGSSPDIYSESVHSWISRYMG